MEMKKRAQHKSQAPLAPAIGLFASLLFSACAKNPSEGITDSSATANVDPLKVAALKIEEDRGEPVGHEAEIVIPEELKHYRDRRRFLAVQMAEWRRQNYAIPHDYAELIRMIRKGELVEMEPLGEDYILYGVGESETDGLFTHYDRETREEIPLFPSYDDFAIEQARLAESITEIQSGLASLQKELKQTSRRDRDHRRELQDRINQARQSLKETSRKKTRLAYFYDNPARRNMLMSEHQVVADFAANLEGKSYNLNSPEERKHLKIRLLSFIRPEARDLIKEIARAYRERFGRPLPITSLARTEEYQHHLSETNKNATLIAVPPHTTGLAFDIYNGYMTATEQNELMSDIADLESKGRAEALRENRNHIHVFAFAKGQPPDERSITRELRRTRGR